MLRRPGKFAPVVAPLLAVSVLLAGLPLPIHCGADPSAAAKLREQLKGNGYDDHSQICKPGTTLLLDLFEEIWTKKDDLSGQEFDPKIFFALYDVDLDNSLGLNEIRQMLLSDVFTDYDTNNPGNDPTEMEEQVETMCDYIFKEIDVNKNGSIGLEEFVDYIKLKGRSCTSSEGGDENGAAASRPQVHAQTSNALNAAGLVRSELPHHLHIRLAP